MEEVVEVAEAPGNETEAGDAEEGVEDLGVNFDPDAAWGIDIVAFFLAVGTRRVAHEFFAAADQEEEEHATPGDHVEAVNDNKKAEGGDGEAPEGFEADEGGFAPGVFWGKFVAGRVDTIFVGALIFIIGGRGG